MITDLPTLVVLLLIVLTVLGAIMGYCVAVIRVKRFASASIEEARREIEQNRSAAKPEIAVTKYKVDQSRAGQPQASTGKKYDAAKVKALIRRSLKQAKRIKALEARLALMKAERTRLKQQAALEKSTRLKQQSALEKSTRLKQQSALEKSTKNEESRLARAASVEDIDNDDVPILSRRVDPASTRRTKKPASKPELDPASTQRAKSSTSKPEQDPASTQRTKKSTSKLESDLTVVKDGGAGPRG